VIAKTHSAITIAPAHAEANGGTRSVRSNDRGGRSYWSLSSKRFRHRRDRSVIGLPSASGLAKLPECVLRLHSDRPAPGLGTVFKERTVGRGGSSVGVIVTLIARSGRL